MPFFEDIPESPAPEPVPERPQPWMAPPVNYTGGLLPVQYLLGRTSEIAIVLSGTVVYPTGFRCDLVLRSRYGSHDPDFFWHFAGRKKESFDRMLKFGFEYPDGSKVTNLDRSPFMVMDDEVPDGPTMVPQGGGGGGHVWTQGLWIWPLPEGDVTVHLEWSSQGLPESTAVIDGDRIGAAAAEAVELWPEPDGGAPSVEGSAWTVMNLSEIDDGD